MTEEDLARFQDAVSLLCAPVLVRPLFGVEFASSVRSTSADGLMVAQVRTTPSAVTRTGRLLRSTDPEFVKLAWQRHGSSRLEQDGRRCVVPAGHLVAYETTKPYQLHTDAESRALHGTAPRTGPSRLAADRRGIVSTAREGRGDTFAGRGLEAENAGTFTGGGHRGIFTGRGPEAEAGGAFTGRGGRRRRSSRRRSASVSASTQFTPGVAADTAIACTGPRRFVHPTQGCPRQVLR